MMVISVHAQVKYLSNEIKASLSANDVKEIKTAEEIKSYGNKLMKEAKLIEDDFGISMMEIDDYEAEKIRQMDAETLDVVRKSARKKIQASNYYGNHNLIITSIYRKRLNELLLQIAKSDKKNIDALMEKNTSLMKTSSLIRREALQMNNELLVYPYLMDAEKIELMAINKLQQAFLVIYKDAIIDKPNDEISELKSLKSPKNLYYKIQVAASKKILTNKQIKNIPVGKELITSEYKHGWYKYSLTKKFKTYQEAFEYKQLMSVSGAFILAFVNDKKVHVSQAIEWQNKKMSTKLEKRKNKIVYRLRIGISTEPFSDLQMKKLKSGGKPIVIVDYGSWFTYTVGDFDTKKEAIKFKKIKGLTNATVVAYKNGKSIEDN